MNHQMDFDSYQPEFFSQEKTTVWDFPERGSWATHKPDYRGNFAPQIPRNLILNYSNEGDLILDPMVGSGTTLIESKLLNRNAIGYDINQNAVDITFERIKFDTDNNSIQEVKLGNAKYLENADNTIDLIITHPPYFNLVKYSNEDNPEDLSNHSKIETFLKEIDIVISELYRVLKPNHYCAILIGDTRKGQHYIPLSYFVFNICLKNHFVLKEEIIKTQHNTKFGPRWSSNAKKYKFFLIMHEHLYVFRKPVEGENFSRIKYSTWDGIKNLLN